MAQVKICATFRLNWPKNPQDQLSSFTNISNFRRDLNLFRAAVKTLNFTVHQYRRLAVYGILKRHDCSRFAIISVQSALVPTDQFHATSCKQIFGARIHIQNNSALAISEQ